MRLSANSLNRLDESDKVTGADQELDLSQHRFECFFPTFISLFIPSASSRIIPPDRRTQARSTNEKILFYDTQIVVSI